MHLIPWEEKNSSVISSNKQFENNLELKFPMKILFINLCRGMNGSFPELF
ncbi:MAG: hypothetical protein PWQ77_2026 [Kosmotogales bacterium]|nr:hypothetical protein [Kosmotogales bacterium]